jgi:stage IV sporulation protein A
MEGYMEKFDLYKDIAQRTGGDIYVGVVGPVRAGKSTFITKFMDALVLPNVENRHEKERMTDEMPQAAAGKTIMTTQPKFVPNEAALIKLRENVEVKVRMVDCVGYLIDGAQGHKEGNKPRLVKTPWQEAEMPFEQAAETGTKKVIAEHSTIGIVVTSDGSIGTELSRAAYVPAEERVVNELKSRQKPFVVILNTVSPSAKETEKLRAGLQERYSVPVMAVNVLSMGLDEINAILESMLLEFPLANIEFEIPQWMQTLELENDIIADIAQNIRGFSETVGKMRDYSMGEGLFSEHNDLNPIEIVAVSLGEGKITYSITAKPHLFYKILSEECGVEIGSDFHLMSYVKGLAHAKKEYDRLKAALDEAEEKGYGVVSPGMEQMALEEPEIVKSGGRFGVRLKASAPSLHIMKVDIQTEISPIVGTEAQSEELVKYLLSEFEHDPKGIWKTEMFGKSLHSLVSEGINSKLHSMPVDTQKKMRRTLSRIVNEGRGGIICILL